MISAQAVADMIREHDQGVVVCGNGGSMAQAQHFAAELVSLRYPAMALSDPAVLSALANDDGFQNVFASYLAAFLGRFELFIGLTTSGSSNVLRAAGLASTCMKTVLVTGNSLLTPAPIDLHVQFEGDTQEVQEQTLEWIHEVYDNLRE
jgi:D-sedoheptulose 7-phosphate isomerase